MKGLPMKRHVTAKLEAWKRSPRRKPLLLRGARQVGKTWALTEFGRASYENMAYFNFDLNAEYRQFFQLTKAPRPSRRSSTSASRRLTITLLALGRCSGWLCLIRHLSLWARWT